MKEILIPLNITTTAAVYDTKQSFSSSDEASGVLTFTTTADVSGTVASLTIRNASENANRQTVLIERLDVNSSPFSYTFRNPLPFGQYEGTVLLKKNLTVIASVTFLFGVNSSLSAEVLPDLVKAYALDELVENVETEVSYLKDAFTLTVSETLKGVNKSESRWQAQENVRYLNEHTRKANELERIANENARMAAEVERKDTFDTLVGSAVIEQTVVQEVANEFQQIESTYANRLLSAEQQLAEIAYLPSSFKELTDVDDSQAINRALAHVNSLGGGKVKIPYKITPYLIGSTLKIYSNTTLEVDPFAVLKLADGANTRLLENANMTTQNTLTIIDKNIKIIGGIWDGNRPNQTKKWDGEPNTTSIISGIFLSGVENLIFKPTRIINTVTYGFLICNAKNIEIENIDMNVGNEIQNNCDGFHFMGPIDNMTITKCRIKSEDNAIALNADDVGHGPFATMGDMNNISIDDIIINNHEGGQGMRLLSGTSKIHNVSIRNVTGKAAYLAVMSTLDIGSGDFDKIMFENIDMEWFVSSWRFFAVNGNCGTLKLRNILIDGDDYLRANNVGNVGIYAYSTTGTPNCIIDNLILDNIRMNDTTAIGPTVTLFYVDNYTTLNNLEMLNIQSKNNLKTFYVISLSKSVINRLSRENMDTENTNNIALHNDQSTVSRDILDGVETTVFTPSIQGATTVGEATYSSQNGRYVKVGKKIYFEISIAWTGHTGTGQMRIPLPKTVLQNGVDFHPVYVFGIIPVAAGAKLEGLINKAGSRLQFYTLNAGVMSAFDVTASGTLYLSGYYIEN